MVANSVEQMLADMIGQGEITVNDERKIRVLLAESRKLPMVNEVAIPKVGTSTLRPTKTCKKFKIQVYIYMHNYLDEVDLWRKTISLEKATKNKTDSIASKVELMVESIMSSLFNNKGKHDFVEAMEAWLEELEKNEDVELTTIDAYKQRFKLIRWYFDEHPVSVEDFSAVKMLQFCQEALKNGRVKAIIDKETGKPTHKLSRRTVRDAHGLIYNFFENCGLSYSLNENPCLGTKVPTIGGKKNKEDKTKPAWMELDVYIKYKQWLIENTKGRKYQHLQKMIEISEFGIQTGTRREEICGLHWDKISFDKKTIRIVDTRVITTKGAQDKICPKTENSYRIYNMTTSIFKMLKGIQQRQIDLGLYDPYGFVFIWEDPKAISYRKPYDPGYLTKTFKKTVVACPYTDNALHIHSLRHSACSICYMLGWDIEDARDWLGHGSEDVTKEVYQHYERPVSREKVKVLEDAFTWTLEEATQWMDQRNGKVSQETYQHNRIFNKDKVKMLEDAFA